MASRSLPFRRPARTRGQALAEFALVAPIFLFVMLGLIELGRAVYYTQILDTAARDAARYAIVHGEESGISGCESGPLPPSSSTAPCDVPGNNVIAYVKARAIGVTDMATDLVAHVKWCSASAIQAGLSSCYDSLPCPEWASSSDLSVATDGVTTGLGDGDNRRGQLAAVCISYSYNSLLSTYLPVPDFNVGGRASLVVNH